MEYPEKINTIDNFFESTFKEKGSVFVSQVHHVEKKDEAEKILSRTRKKYYDATHHCFAYKLLGDTIKYSDDGEPNGTAGIRILNAIDHFKLINVLNVVIRYFGGTKLGVGPLGKAYYQAAFNTLEGAKRLTKILYKEVIISTDFNYVSHVHRILNSFDTKLLGTNYDPGVSFNCLIKPADIATIQARLTELSKGKIIFTSTESIYYR